MWKVSKYEVFSGPYFPAFGLNTERYLLSLRIQSECGKMRTRKNSVFGNISHSITYHKTFPIIISFNSSSLLRFYSACEPCPRYIITTHINNNDVVTFLHGYSTVTRNCTTFPCSYMNLKNIILFVSTTEFR